MKCAWTQLKSVLPLWLRRELELSDREHLQEIRLRLHAPPELVVRGSALFLDRVCTEEDLRFCVNTASQYSPWASQSTSEGFLTAPGGHRIGLCGEVAGGEDKLTFRKIHSLCIRVAKDYPGLAEGLAGLDGSVLILGAPGWGKTTLLRDLIRQRSDRRIHTAVVDQRGELFPGDYFERGCCTDVLLGCGKTKGIDMILRTMGPQCIAMDEITSPDDCAALTQAAGCGVRLMATAHASSLEDFCARPVYEPLIRLAIFDHYVILRKDKTWQLERRKPCIINGLVRC